MAERSRASTGRPRPWVAVAVAVLCGLVALTLNGRRQDERTLRAANEAGSAGRYDDALRLAGTLHDGTTAPDARYVEAQVAIARSDYARARRALEASLALRPNDWRARRDLASVLLFLGRRAEARVQYGRALALNPRMPRLAAFVG